MNIHNVILCCIIVLFTMTEVHAETVVVGGSADTTEFREILQGKRPPRGISPPLPKKYDLPKPTTLKNISIEDVRKAIAERERRGDPEYYPVAYYLPEGHPFKQHSIILNR